MANGLMQERQAAAMGASPGVPLGGGGPAGLTQGQGSPPPTALGGQQPAGAAPQGQPTPGFPEMASQMLQTLMQGNEADLQIFGQMIGQLQSLVEDRQGQGAPAPVAGAAPPGVTLP